MTSFSVYNDKTFNVLTVNTLSHETLTGSILNINTDLGVGGNLAITGGAQFDGLTTVSGNMDVGLLDEQGSARLAFGGGRIKFFTAIGPVPQLPAPGRIPVGALVSDCTDHYNTLVQTLRGGGFGLFT